MGFMPSLQACFIPKLAPQQYRKNLANPSQLGNGCMSDKRHLFELEISKKYQAIYMIYPSFIVLTDV